MKLKHLIITVIFVASTNYTFSQSDISILTSTNDRNRFTVEWRKPIFEKMNFKVGLTSGGSVYGFFQSAQFTDVSNDTLRETYFSRSQNQFGIKLGVERQIKSSVFYYGLDVITGYQTKYRNYYRIAKDVTQVYPSSAYYYGVQDAEGNRIDKFITVDALASLGMNLKVSKRFLFNVSVGLGISSDTYLKESKRSDPLAYYNSAPRDVFSFDLSGTIGLRYKLFKPEE